MLKRQIVEETLAPGASVAFASNAGAQGKRQPGVRWQRRKAVSPKNSKALRKEDTCRIAGGSRGRGRSTYQQRAVSRTRSGTIQISELRNEERVRLPQVRWIPKPLRVVLRRSCWHVIDSGGEGRESGSWRA